MENKRIMVIGSPGAGKSTFCYKLKEITGLPLYHLDMIYHKADRTTVSRQEFDRALDAILAENQWIIDGNYQRTIEKRLRSCDTVFLLDYPLELCLSSIESRVGKKRSDMPWVETELDEEFRQFVVDFPKSKLPSIYNMLEKVKDKKVVIFKSRKQADDYLQEMKKMGK